MQARDRYFRAGGIRLRYRDEGAGPAVVLVHGWTLDLDIWEPQAAELARELRVIRLDRRGFGRSEGDPDPAADPGDLESLLDHLHIARAAQVGMSQGARAALAFALSWPARVTGLVLDGLPGDAAAIATGDEEDFSFDEFRKLAQEAGLESFRVAWRRHPLMQLHAGDPQSVRLLDRVLARYPGRDLLGPAAMPAAPVPQRLLAELPVPVLVVNGGLDTRPRRLAGDRLCRALTQAERALVPGAGHLANLDDPRAYNDVIRSFLRRQARAAA
ncbi:MAG: alpha/beta fold hydrolase [Gammaproteobacteria bacterium]